MKILSGLSLKEIEEITDQLGATKFVNKIQGRIEKSCNGDRYKNQS